MDERLFIYFGVHYSRNSTMDPTHIAQILGSVAMFHLILKICSF